MTIDPAIVNFLNDICDAFPEVRSRMDVHEEDMGTFRMEEFAKATTETFGRGEVKRGIEYLAFMSKRLNKNNPREYEYIDVYYVENLFWPRQSEAAKIGWPFVPENLKALYIGFHGKPPI